MLLRPFVSHSPDRSTRSVATAPPSCTAAARITKDESGHLLAPTGAGALPDPVDSDTRCSGLDAPHAARVTRKMTSLRIALSTRSVTWLFKHLRRPRRRLDASRAPVADRHLPRLVDDRDGAASAGKLQHLRDARVVLADVDVLDLEPLLRVRLTGARGVGSRVLSEDPHRRHRCSFFQAIHPPPTTSSPW